MKMMDTIKSEFGFSPELEDEYVRDLDDLPWDREQIIMQYKSYVLYKDKYPVTEGHVLYVPRSRNYIFIIDCFTEAYKRGILVRETGEWEAFNIGLNYGIQAGQTIDWPHVHLIPRRTRDCENPKGGVRNVIPGAGDYTGNVSYSSQQVFATTK